MAELKNAFEQTNILSGRGNTYLNVLQVQRLLESNIPDCQVISVVVKQNCTLIRLTTNGQSFDFAVASNAVACRSMAGNLSIDYNGILTETILTIVNEFKTDIKSSSTKTIESNTHYTVDQIVPIIIKTVNENGDKYKSFKEITSRGYWKGLAQTVLGMLGTMPVSETQVKTVAMKVLDKELSKLY